MFNEAYVEKKSREMLEKIKKARTEIKVKGTTYYVSADGDDTNDGKSPATAFKTTDAVNECKDITEGDAVLFRRGDIFRGHVNLQPGVVYSGYGTGEKPRIYGALENASELSWTRESENIYSVPISHSKDIGCIVFNEGEEWGYKKFLEGDTDVLMDLDFYHDIENHKLYLFSEKGNPALRWSDIELCPKVHGMSGRADGCTIDGLVIKYCGAHGISFGSVTYPPEAPCYFSNLYNVTIRNCEFEWIGGSKQMPHVRFGNGVEVWGGCENYLIENCYFNQIYDAAVTQQYSGACICTEDMPLKVKNTVMRGNLIENSTYSYEYFITEFKNDGTREKKVDSNWGFENTYFENNICRKCGYGWGNQRPDRTTASHIKSWGHFNNSENFIIRNNIFDRADYRLVEVKAHFDKCLPKLENNIYCQYLGKDWVSTNSGVSVFSTENVKNPQNAVNDEKAVAFTVIR